MSPATVFEISEQTLSNLPLDLEFTNQVKKLPKDNQTALCIVRRLAFGQKIGRIEFHTGKVFKKEGKKITWIVGNHFSWDMGEVLAWAILPVIKEKQIEKESQ